jgi:hypothetical protein
VTLSGATGPVTQVAAGAKHSLAVTSTGQLYAFGENEYGQLGIEVNFEPNPTPALVTLPGAAGPVGAGTDHSLVVVTRVSPGVDTGAASSVTQAAATLNATVNPNGEAVSDCHFEYGTTASYGASVPCTSLPGSGEAAVAVSASATGLSAKTTYRFRIVATNPSGTSYGSDRTFAAGTVSITFNYTGAEQTFTVPAGVFSVQVLAVGGSGGTAGALGGVGAQVSGDLSVTPGETLYVEVGGNGQSQGPSNYGGSGGFNGGGSGGGGGGGASDVRTSPRASGLFPGDRLLVAGGGGGAGTKRAYACRGGAGGAAGQAGHGKEAGNCSNRGGGAGTQSSGGAAAPTTGEECPGQNGQFGIGGEGGTTGTNGCRGEGGGGGGGYYGGGGGTGGYGSAGGGGGGGSSLVPAGGSVVLASSGTQPHVRITYTPSPPTVVTGAASSVTQTSATLNATVNPNDGEVSDCHFDYGTSLSYGSSVPCSALPGLGTSAVAVSAPVGGLVAGATYYFRIVATNPGGTSYGADQALTTLMSSPGQGVLPSEERKTLPVPTVANAAQAHSAWSEGNRLAAFSRKKQPPVGTTFSFSLNEQARVSFAFTQQVGGRKVKGKCVAQTKKNRHNPSCKRTVQRGTLSFTGHIGRNKVSFQGRISAAKKLPLGCYKLVIIATNATGQS